jgi:uncharacterized membrane protein YccC
MVSQKVGGWAFILGVVIAIIAGLVSTFAFSALASGAAYVLLVLVVLGLIVGFLNVKDKEVVNFLIAAIALMAVGTANLGTIDKAIPLLGTLVQTIVQYIAAFVAPAALVVALEEVYSIAKKV